jgi:putative phosphoserine phosphatase/1-acylglycerol-3-phosphate O-acyltransferase
VTLEEILDRIAAADPGPQVVACFDYDGTVISGYSATAFYRHRILHGQLGPVELARTIMAGFSGIKSDEDFAAFLELSLSSWAGREEAELLKLGDDIFKHDVGSRLHTEVWQIVQAHHERGHTVVLASSATRFQVEPMARELGADHVLCTSLEVRDGLLTGRAEGRPLWGIAKAEGLLSLAEEHDFDLDRSFAYSNGGEDIPLLCAVGNPIAVEPEEVLRDAAVASGWPILRCRARGGTLPSVGDVVRTGAFYGGLFAGFGVGMGLGLLQRSRARVLDIGAPIGADVGLALAGVDVDVVSGQEHLWSARPCVFVFNHQSKLDPIVLASLLRGRFTGVAKKQAKNIPVFGQVFQLAGVAFVDRGNTGQAKKALEPAVRKVRDERISLVIAPEGTRSVTPRLGPFKKGAFHIAMQAEVPMVPVVMRNVGEVMWRGSQVISPGRVEVCVLPPVDTSEWTVETIADHVAEVREQFLDTLAHWPGSARPALEAAT